MVIGLAVAATAGYAIRIYDSAPALAQLHPAKEGTVSRVYSADGSLLGVIHGDTIRQPVSSRQIARYLEDATVAIEDKNFYREGGIDPAGIARAAWNDLLAGGKPIQGGSTITQQLVRNLYIARPKETLRRKIIEARLANEVASAHSKKWILTRYLNIASYGTNNGATAIGVEAAAETYFSKHARDLTLPQAALIAGLPQAPSAYNPLLHPKAALARRNAVLRAMKQRRDITVAQYTRAVGRGLGLRPGHEYTSIREPYVFNFVKNELEKRYGLTTVQEGGLKVYTTIQPRLQAAAQRAVDSCAVCYPGGPASALASIDPSDGEIVALASTRRYSSSSQFNLAAQAHRQPGSSFKPYVLTTAIKQGIEPSSTYYDGSSPKSLAIAGGLTWTVNNAEPGGGVMSVSKATWNSVDTVYAQLALDVGPTNFAKTAYDMGITSPLGIKSDGSPCKSGPSCYTPPADAIGGTSAGVTPLEQADAYATLANGGVHHDATAIAKVVFPNGRVAKPGASAGRRVLTPGQAYDVTKVLEGVITKGTGAGYTDMGCASEAGKTGTTDGLSDAWFVGYTPLYSTAVWTGHPTSRAYTGYGGPTSGPIWRSYMEAAQGSDCPTFAVPASLPSLSPLSGSRTASVPRTPLSGPGTSPGASFSTEPPSAGPLRTYPGRVM